MRAFGRVPFAAVLAGAMCMPASAQAANWSVERVNHMVLSPPAGVTVREMSGLTYVGELGGAHRFIAAEENLGELVQIDVTLSDAGAITAISHVTAIDITPTLDFEGVAYTNAGRNSVFLSDENNPGVREVSLATGGVVQVVDLPAVFNQANRRPNLGFESLTRSPDGTVMWTANEQALTVDGPTSTAMNGTTVRLLRLDVLGDSIAAGAQFAYVTEPIHGALTFGSPQSGLSELVALPDGTLLALERSVVVGAPVYLNRIFEIDFAGATDISAGTQADGLIGKTFSPVSKQLLWSGAVDGASGQNMEGLALGPRLPNGDWILIGVVDDDPTDSDTLSRNTIVAFTLRASVSADFDADGDVDGNDLLHWQRGAGKPSGAAHGEGDADRDGDVDAADMELWRGSFTAPTSANSGSGLQIAAFVPEPAAYAIAWMGLASTIIVRSAARNQEFSGRLDPSFR